MYLFFFFSSRRRHTRYWRDWSSDVCSSDLITDGQLTGPYSFAKVAGPAHLSFADRGVTFATTTERGVCFTLREPVPGIAPFGRLPHPGVTVTVVEPERLLEVAPLR